VPFILGALDAAARDAPAARGGPVVAFGFSAGAFMALRLACDAPPGRLAAVVAFSGGGAADEARCAPREARPVLIIHGARDLEVPFAGSGVVAGVRADARFPGARDTLAQWARKNRCAAASAAAPQRTVRRGFAGSGGDADVEVVSYDNCSAPVEGWLVAQWGHLPPRAPAQALFLNAARRALRRQLQ
jgi:poly(3-hydroxybutyrate) depolymerase